jgi:hypothetical protein
MLKTRIPLKESHVRQFVIARYGGTDPANKQVIELSKKTMLGTMTELACEKVGFRHVLPKADPVDESVCIILIYPNSLKNHFVHPGKLEAFAKMLHYLFNQAFLEALETAVMLGISDYEAVNMFMDRYGITEDMVAADTLRKKWRDHQRAMVKKVDSMLKAA